MDSSTQTKYSEHLILHLPGDAVFANTSEQHIFVSNLITRHVQSLAAHTYAVAATWLTVTYVGFRCRDESSSDPAFAELFVSSASGTNMCFVDEGVSRTQTRALSILSYSSASTLDDSASKWQRSQVYTRNRCFRLFLSSKFGKTAILQRAREQTGTDDNDGDDFGHLADYEYFIELRFHP